MTENIDLREKEKRKSTVQSLCVWKVDKSSLIRSSFEFLVILNCQDSDIIFFFQNAIFERIVEIVLDLIKIFRSTLHEFEFSNCMRSYFRFLVSIESINKRWLKIFFVLRS
jgi:hypothetical protein